MAVSIVTEGCTDVGIALGAHDLQGSADPLAPLVELPGVVDASDAARAAIARAHRHRVNLRGWPATAAEAAVRAARASSVLDGGALSISS